LKPNGKSTIIEQNVRVSHSQKTGLYPPSEVLGTALVPDTYVSELFLYNLLALAAYERVGTVTPFFLFLFLFTVLGG
jgi:hypothetical protein